MTLERRAAPIFVVCGSGADFRRWCQDAPEWLAWSAQYVTDATRIRGLDNALFLFTQSAVDRDDYWNIKHEVDVMKLRHGGVYELSQQVALTP